MTRLHAALLSLVLVLLVTAGVVVVNQPEGRAGRTATGSTVGGLDVSGLDRVALRSLLVRASTGPSLAIQMGGRRTRLPARDLGLSVDVDATTDRVLEQAGRGGLEITPLLTTQENVLNRTVKRLAATASVAPVSGDVALAGATVRVVPPRIGQQADPEAIEAALRNYTQTLPLAGSLSIAVKSLQPSLPQARVEALADRARALLGDGLILQAGSVRTRLAPPELAAELRTVITWQGPDQDIGLALRPTALERLAAPVSEALSRQPRDAVLTSPAPAPLLTQKASATWSPRPVLVRGTGVGLAGQTAQPRDVLAALQALLVQGSPTGAPITVAARPSSAVDAAAAGQVNSVLGTFTTSYACCQPRTKNIALIARVVDGTVLSPGESFSLNDRAGRRTRAKGYVEAPFILDGELSQDVGGGVSQFATTLFNAAYFAGVRLDDYQAHSFYISRYPPGREATVNFPGIDLRFTNDTGAPIIIRTATTSSTVTVALYGKDDGRSVAAVTGPRRSASGGGFRITVTRILTIPGRETRREAMSTLYNRAPAS